MKRMTSRQALCNLSGDRDSVAIVEEDLELLELIKKYKHQLYVIDNLSVYENAKDHIKGGITKEEFMELREFLR